MRSTSLPISLSCVTVLLSALAASGCSRSDSGGGDGASPSGAQAAGAPNSHGKMNVRWEWAKLDLKDAPIAAAYAYIKGTKSEPTLQLDLFTEGAADKADCGAMVPSFGKKITEKQLGITLETSAGGAVPFSNAAGKVQKVGYTVYYRSPGKTEGSNSGNGPGKTENTLDITSLDDKEMKGTFTMKADGMDFAIPFTAKVCERELSE